MPRINPLLVAALLTLLSPLNVSAVNYYVDSVSGSDNNNGTSESTPWRNLAKVNGIPTYLAGDTINFRSGQTFAGSLTVTSSGTAASPIIYRTYGGSEKAILQVSATNANGVTMSGKSNVRLQDIYVKGPWLYTQTGTNTPIGIHITGVCNNICIDRVRVSNFQGFGIRFESTNSQLSTGFRLRHSEVHDTGNDGVRVGGTWKKINHRDTYIAHTKTYRCKGYDSQESSGSGILLSQVDVGLVEFCEATNTGSGWGGRGGGPIGIWSWDCNAVVVQYSYAHRNSNGAGSYDGGGFDIDGGDTNCIIQYCYSHENDGAGYFIAHFHNSEPTNNNVIRYNISQNDARATPQGALNLWGPSTDNHIYNNVIYGDEALLKRESSGTGQKIFNNIFFASGTNYVLHSVGTTGIEYQNNCYWAANGAPRFRWGNNDHIGLAAWRAASGMERDAQGHRTGFQVDPQFVTPGGAPMTGVDVTKLHEIMAYKLKNNSPLINQATDLGALWGAVHPGSTDYHGTGLPKHGANDVGAHEFSDPLPPVPAPASNLLVTGRSASTITLAWTDNSTTEAGFRVQQSSNGVAWQMLDMASAGTTSFTCAGLLPNTTYHLRVVAFNANGEASPTNSVQATTTPPFRCRIPFRVLLPQQRW